MITQINALRKVWVQGIQLRSIANNALWLLLSRLFRLVVVAAMAIWTARYLAPELFGVLNYGLAIAALFGPLGSFGIDQIAIRDIVRWPQQADDILAAAITLKALGGMLVTVIASLVAYALKPADFVGLFVALLAGIATIFNAASVVEIWFQSQARAKPILILQTMSLLFAFTFRALLILSGSSFEMFAWSVVVEAIVSSIIFLIGYRIVERKNLKPKIQMVLIKRMLKSSFPAMLSGIAIAFYMRLDQILLGHLATSETVGIYSVAVKLSEMWYFVPAAIVQSVFPTIVKSAALERSVYHAHLSVLFKFLVLFSYLVAIPVSLFANVIIDVLFGQAYSAAANVLAIYIWSGVAVALGIAREAYLVSEDLLPFSLLATLTGTLINIGLNIVLIPVLGALGSAIATVVAYSAAAIFSGLIYSKTRAVSILMLKSLMLVAK
jgi:PST family polysaccharide transporter